MTRRKKSNAEELTPDGCLFVLGVLALFIVFGVIVDIFGEIAIFPYGLLLLGIFIYYLLRDKRKEKANIRNQEIQRQIKLADEEAARDREIENEILRKVERQKQDEEIKRKQDEQQREMKRSYLESEKKRHKKMEEKNQKKLEDSIKKAAYLETMYWQSQCTGICSDCTREKHGLPCIQDMKKNKL
jgi:hypothetical protein